MLRIWRLALVSLGTILIYLTSNGAAHARLDICNATSDVMYIAEMDYQKQDWLTNSWFRAIPRECAVLIKEPLKNRILYYVAFTASELSFTDPTAGNGVTCLTLDPVIDRAEDGCREKGAKRYNWNKLEIGGNAADFVLTLKEDRVSAPSAARACDGARKWGLEKFASCWVRRMVSAKQGRIIECAEQQRVWLAQAVCAANPVADAAVVRAAACTSPGSSASDLALCMGVSEITPEITRVIGCLQSNRDGTWEAAVCAGEGWITREQRTFAACAMKARLASTALVGCVSTQGTLEELQKCVEKGTGADGCFGADDFVQSVDNAWRDIRFETGPTDDLVVGDQGFSVRTLGSVAKDIRIETDRSNQFGGCGTWLGKTLGVKC